MIDLCHSGELHGSSRHEHLFTDEYFRAVNRALHHDKPQLVARQLHNGFSCNTFKNVVRYGWCDQDPIAQHEDIHCRAFRDMPILIQHECFVEAGAVRVCFDEGGVCIGACHLAACRDDVIINAPPRGNGHVSVRVVLDVLVIRHDEHAELIFQVMQFYTDAQICLVKSGAHVNILLPVVGAEQVERELDQALFIVTGLHYHHARRVQQSSKMVIGTKNEETSLLFVPVCPHAAEYGCTIQKTMCGDINFCVRKRDDLSLKKSVLREIHQDT